MTACDHGPGGLKALEMHVCGVFADYLPACQHVPTVGITGSAGFLAPLFRVPVPGSCKSGMPRAPVLPSSRAR